MIKLLPCPFCQSDVKLIRDSGNNVWNQSWKVLCPCGIRGTQFFGSSSWRVVKKEDDIAIKSAVDQWNRRPPTSY